MSEDKLVIKDETHDLRSFRENSEKRDGMCNYIPELVYLTIHSGLPNVNTGSI